MAKLGELNVSITGNIAEFRAKTTRVQNCIDELKLAVDDLSKSDLIFTMSTAKRNDVSRGDSVACEKANFEGEDAYEASKAGPV